MILCMSLPISIKITTTITTTISTTSTTSVKIIYLCNWPRFETNDTMKKYV